jgi:hypothetical protein
MKKNTKNSNGKIIHRKGSGKTAGSTSFVTVRLGDLCSKIADTEMLLKVSRIQMEALGLITKLHDPSPAKALTNPPAIVTVAPKPVVIINEVDFDAPPKTEPVKPETNLVAPTV